MNFDPQKSFIGLMDFFSILLPGALLTLSADGLGGTDRTVGSLYVGLVGHRRGGSASIGWGTSGCGGMENLGNANVHGPVSLYCGSNHHAPIVLSHAADVIQSVNEYRQLRGTLSAVGVVAPPAAFFSAYNDVVAQPASETF